MKQTLNEMKEWYLTSDWRLQLMLGSMAAVVIGMIGSGVVSWLIG